MSADVVDLPRGPRRARMLWRMFREERSNPEPFYRALAAIAVADLDTHHGPLAGQTLVDLGCGPGYYTDAFRGRGATVVPVDNSTDELELGGAPPEGYVLADAGDLPLDDASVDGVFCSNMFEHTPSAAPIVAEIERVLRPGGWAYISWTNWYSPWGGHLMAPYHYLGPRLGPRLYERRHGKPEKHAYGETLWACHIGPTLRLVASRPGLEISRAEPRYWPWARAVMKVPGLRELVAWNCVIRVRKV
ncbi:class I SAM-dependent methyltransferase [Baekduia soli]|uniref:Class I SAM-dependent methyltransferase n=1 Tax=Baekduia soli TaxID=496014 RepID=A0A5B8U983_9ACTN|nr:class I SAM-dependent methyltransferase [Baekduia soli]QEC49565.1 class I SAM-dependent methyltransferase [Baekduia soli]